MRISDWSSDVCSSDLGQFLLPLFRIAALLMSMPLIGTQLVPMSVRLYLSLAIALVLVPTLPPMPVVESLSLASLLLIAEQLVIGVMLRSGSVVEGKCV